MKRVAESPERAQMMKYLDKYDGEKWRYRFFTRPMIHWMAGTPYTSDHKWTPK